MAGFIGAKASVVTSGAERKQTYAITTTTTSLTGLAYTPTKVHVYHNGIRLVDGTDYTATNGTSITLTTAAEDGDEVVVISYATFQTSDTVSAANGGTFAGNLNTVDIRPTTDDNNDLGTSSKRFQDLYLSGGLYVGGTGSSNYLDDYEEGTHTTTLTLGSGSATMSKDKLYYTKIGRVVHIIGTIRISSVSSPSGDLSFSVPFVHVTTTDGEAQAGAAILTNVVATGQNRDFYLEQSEGQSKFFVYDAASTALTNAGDMLKANTTLRINYSYHTA